MINNSKMASKGQNKGSSPATPKKKSMSFYNRRFKLKPTTFTAIVQWPVAPDCGNLKVRLGNVRVTQIPVNSNIATTGHKLQGMSKDTLIVKIRGIMALLTGSMWCYPGSARCLGFIYVNHLIWIALSTCQTNSCPLRRE